MFGKKKDFKPEQPLSDKSEGSRFTDNVIRKTGEEKGYGKAVLTSILTDDTKIKGTIKFGGTLRIDGRLDGEITTDNGELIVGKTGTIKASIKTGSAVIEGRVEGNIVAANKVVLKHKARLTGDLQAKKLVMEEGVVFVGRCNINPGS